MNLKELICALVDHDWVKASCDHAGVILGFQPDFVAIKLDDGSPPFSPEPVKVEGTYVGTGPIHYRVCRRCGLVDEQSIHIVNPSMIFPDTDVIEIFTDDDFRIPF